MCSNTWAMPARGGGSSADPTLTQAWKATTGAAWFSSSTTSSPFSRRNVTRVFLPSGSVGAHCAREVEALGLLLITPEQAAKVAIGRRQRAVTSLTDLHRSTSHGGGPTFARCVLGLLAAGSYTAHMVRPSRCPICRRQLPVLDADAPHRPFCSPRCKSIDLGGWLDGRYRI